MQKTTMKERIATIVLAISPILSPYSVLRIIPLNTFLIIIVCAFLFSMKAKINLKNYKFILILWFTHLLLSVSVTVFSSFSNSLLSSLIVGTVNVIGIVYLSSNSNFSLFVKYSNRIGIFSCLFLFSQAISLALGVTPLSGKIIGLNLLDYSSFVQTTWGFRLNSIFQEPSYFAIYTLPLFAYNLKNRKLIFTFIYFLALLLSSSSLGIIGGSIVVIYFLFVRRIKAIYTLGAIFIFSFIHLILINLSTFYQSSLIRSFEKINNILIDSQIRLSGNFYLFEYLPTSNKLIGVGINQMQNYFGNGISNYSNSIVITVINFGIIGLVSYFIFLVFMGLLAKKEGRFEYFSIFILILLVDYFIYNSFFYYILVFVFIENNAKERYENENIVNYSESTGNKFIGFYK